MRYLLLTLLLFFSVQMKAQNGSYEIKVVSKTYANVRGQLMKISAEGIGVEDYKGNYLTFRASDIIRIKVRKRGLTVAEGLGAGTVTGLGIGLGIWSLDRDENSFKDMLALTTLLTSSGAVGGTIAGVIAEVVNTRLILRVKQDPEKFRLVFKKLEKYVNTSKTEHVASVQY